jgi:hypothetical protein
VKATFSIIRSNPNNKDAKEIEAKLISCFGIRDWSREPFVEIGAGGPLKLVAISRKPDSMLKRQ